MNNKSLSLFLVSTVALACGEADDAPTNDASTSGDPSSGGVTETTPATGMPTTGGTDGQTEDSGTADPTESTGTSEARVLQWLTEGFFPPFNGMDRTGAPVGYDVEYVAAMCEALNADCDTVELRDWPLLGDLVENDPDFHFIAAQHSPTDARRFCLDGACGDFEGDGKTQYIEFSDFYTRAFPIAYFTKTGATFDEADLAGINLALQDDTFHKDFVAQQLVAQGIVADEESAIGTDVEGDGVVEGGPMFLFQNQTDALLAVDSGFAAFDAKMGEWLPAAEADAGAVAVTAGRADIITNQVAINENRADVEPVLPATIDPMEGSVIAVRADEDGLALLAELNVVINDLRDTGVEDELFNAALMSVGLDPNEVYP